MLASNTHIHRIKHIFKHIYRIKPIFEVKRIYRAKRIYGFIFTFCDYLPFVGHDALVSITETLSASISFVTDTVSLSVIDSTSKYISTKFIYYDYNVVQYSSYYIFYSDFFTIIYPDDSLQHEGISKESLIGIICGSVAFVLLIIGIIIFIISRNTKGNLTKSKSILNHISSSDEKEDQSEHVAQEINKLSLDEDDLWLWITKMHELARLNVNQIIIINTRIKNKKMT